MSREIEAGRPANCFPRHFKLLPVVRDEANMAGTTSDHEQAIQDTGHLPD